ncbi:MAG: thioredoxin-disulfide reductase [Thermodesulfobacteriota bacterium]
MEYQYDIIIIGGGPAGLTAALYSARARLTTLVLERLFIGGQVSTTYIVENYPGFPEGIDGPAMMELFDQQAKRFGANIENTEASEIIVDGENKFVLADDNRIGAGAIILATGSDPRKLNVPGEKELAGKGVSYCATCDGALFPEATVAVAGGGDAAVDEGLFLTRFAKKIYVIHRRDELRAEKILQERLFSKDKVEMVWDTVVEKINGGSSLESLSLKNVKDGAKRELEVEGLFIAVGHVPNTQLFNGLVDLDERGYVQANQNMETSVPGIYVAGDVRSGSTQQIATAVGDGSVAAMAAEKYLAQR